jgi:hypothetical protein
MVVHGERELRGERRGQAGGRCSVQRPPRLFMSFAGRVRQRRARGSGTAGPRGGAMPVAASAGCRWRFCRRWWVLPAAAAEAGPGGVGRSRRRRRPEPASAGSASRRGRRPGACSNGFRALAHPLVGDCTETAITQRFASTRRHPPGRVHGNRCHIAVRVHSPGRGCASARKPLLHRGARELQRQRRPGGPAAPRGGGRAAPPGPSGTSGAAGAGRISPRMTLRRRWGELRRRAAGESGCRGELRRRAGRRSCPARRRVVLRG